MHRIVNFLLVVLLVAVCLNLPAQQKQAGKASGSKHVLVPAVYLGHSDYKGGPITKAEFSSLLKQGLTSHDSLGNRYKVVSFDFNYAERGLFEDSIGNLKVMTDFLFEYCPGDTITTNISSSIYDRVKPGDTVFIDRVQVAQYLNKSNTKVDSLIIGAKGLKCVITK